MNARPAPTEAIAALVNDISPNWQRRSGPCQPAEIQRRRDTSRRRDCTCQIVTHEHGTFGAYNRDRCRCDLCRKANNEYQLAHARRRAYQAWSGETAMQDAAGTRRRLQALATLGWSAQKLGSIMGVCGNSVWELSRERVMVRTVTATKVARLYEQLWNTEAPRGRGTTLCKRRAEENGWLPPLAWGDDIDDPDAVPHMPDDTGDPDWVAITEACNGRTVQLTKGERLEAVKILRAKGKSVAEIAELLHVTDRTINRENVRGART